MSKEDIEALHTRLLVIEAALGEEKLSSGAEIVKAASSDLESVSGGSGVFSWGGSKIYTDILDSYGNSTETISLAERLSRFRGGY